LKYRGLAVEHEKGKLWERHGRKTLRVFAARRYKGQFVATSPDGDARLDGLVIKQPLMQPDRSNLVPYEVVACVEAKTRKESYASLKKKYGRQGYMVEGDKVPALIEASKAFGCYGELYVRFLECGTAGVFVVAYRGKELLEWSDDRRRTQATSLDDTEQRDASVSYLSFNDMQILDPSIMFGRRWDDDPRYGT
jgi:hypothetical protein